MFKLRTASLLSYAFCFIFIFLLEHRVNSAQREQLQINNLQDAQLVADRISTSGHPRTKFELGVDNIFNDHSYGNNYAAYHASRSYFRTGDRRRIENIVREIIDHPTDYVVYDEETPLGKRKRLNLIKVFTPDEVHRLLDRQDYNHIGYDPGGASRIDHNDGLSNRAILCFEITNVTANAFDKGRFITGFVSEGGRH
jgi:hypothetical protein